MEEPEEEEELRKEKERQKQKVQKKETKKQPTVEELKDKFLSKPIPSVSFR